MLTMTQKEDIEKAHMKIKEAITIFKHELIQKIYVEIKRCLKD